MAHPGQERRRHPLCQLPDKNGRVRGREGSGGSEESVRRSGQIVPNQGFQPLCGLKLEGK